MRRLEEKYTDLDKCDAWRRSTPTWTNATPGGEVHRLGYMRLQGNCAELDKYDACKANCAELNKYDACKENCADLDIAAHAGEVHRLGQMRRLQEKYTDWDKCDCRRSIPT
jgi:hypothetical protein